MTAMGDEIRFGLLGSLEATVAGQPVPLPGQRVRALLALLLLHANQPVSTQRIITELWGDERPKAARESVHYFVHQLRKALPHAEGDRQGMLERHGGSYLLRVPPDSIDVARFRRGVDAAGAARDGGDHQAAWELYTEALGLWRGPALDDLAEAPFAVGEIARLTEQRLAACEHQFAAGLALGLHERLMAELDAQVRANPDREELRYLLMLALYRSGRQAQALEVYQSVRARLYGRGEPGMRLQQLQRAILTQDPALDLHPLDQAIPSSLSKEVARPDPSPPPAASASPAPPADSNPQPARPPARRQRQTPPVEDLTDERKLVTALVVGIVADPDQIAGDPEEVRARTGETMARAATRIRHYGGVVQTTEIGRLLATFGADRSHDDDPERAVRAALEVVASSDDGSGLAVRAGVATGEVVVTHTTDGPDQVVGDVIQVAVTLEQNAQAGVVLVNAATHQATGRGFRYTEVAPAGSLERSSGLRWWQALEPRGRTGAQAHQDPDAPLVERERELTFLDDILARFLRNREPQCLTMVSEPGLGKSRLVAELARLVDAAPELVGWRVGHARAYGQGALGALVEVVKAEAGVLDGDDGPTTMRKLQEIAAGLFGGDAARVAGSLGQLLGIGGEALPSQPQALFDDWAEFFAAAAEQRPLVLVLEDLQWADEALVEFAGELARRVGPVPLLLVATGRPELLQTVGGLGGGQPNAATLTLTPLTRAGTGVLLDALLAGAAAENPLLGKERLPEPTRTALLDAAGGNPLYVEEYVHMLAGQDAAVPAERSLSMPTSVQQVIAARIDTLPADDKRLLQVAAVIGETCFLGQLVAVTGGDRDKVAGCLRQLERQGFLRRLRVSSVAGETEYAFRHTLIREVAYGQLLRADRAEKHQRAAGWIEQLTPDPGERVELLTYHYGRALELARSAGRPTQALVEQTLRASRMAGDRAASLGSLAAAARAYRAAVELQPPDDPTRPELLLRLGRALVLSAHTGEEPLTQARAAALGLGRQDLAAEADNLIRQLALTSYTDGSAGQQSAQSWLEALGKGGPTVTALGSQAVGHVIACRYDEAITTARVLIAEARRLGLPAEEGHGLHVAGEARIHLGDPAGWEEVEQGLALMDAHQYWRRLFARYGHTSALWWYGDLERCEAALSEALQVAQDKDAAIVSWLEGIGVALEYAAGRWDAVTAVAERNLAGTSGAPGRTASWYRIFRGKVALARGQADQALDDAQAARAVIDVEDLRYRQAALALHGRCLLAAGRRQDAAACLEDLLAEQRTRPVGSCATTDEAMLLIDLGYPAEALPDGLAPTRWHQAVQALVARDFHRAVELLTVIGSVPDLNSARARLHDA